MAPTKKSKKAKAVKPKAVTRKKPVAKKAAKKNTAASKPVGKSRSKSGAGRKPAAPKGSRAASRPAARDLGASVAVPAAPKPYMEDKGTQELNHSGWVHQVRHEPALAEADFRMALQGGKSIYAQYGLGKALFAQGKMEEAIRVFEDVARQLEDGALKGDRVRSDLLHRQCQGYMQLAKTGEWHLGELSGALS